MTVNWRFLLSTLKFKLFILKTFFSFFRFISFCARILWGMRDILSTEFSFYFFPPELMGKMTSFFQISKKKIQRQLLNVVLCRSKPLSRGQPQLFTLTKRETAGWRRKSTEWCSSPSACCDISSRSLRFTPKRKGTEWQAGRRSTKLFIHVNRGGWVGWNIGARNNPLPP